jgi:hypothetical protein
MTQPSSPGMGFAFALQSAKGAKVTDSALMKRMRTLTAMVGPTQASGQFQQEVGGGYHPGGTFKQFSAGVGQVTWYPRLEADIGYLLYALLGSVTAGASTAGPIYTTTFKPVNDVCSHPWLTARSFIPNCASSAQNLGQEIWDAKLSGMSFNVQPGQPAQSQLALLAISSGFNGNASTWNTDMTDTPEDTDSAISAIISGNGITVGNIALVDLGGGVNTDFAVPSLGFQLQIANTLSGDGIRPELVVGSQAMDDLALLGQQVGFNLTYKWRDPKLYKAIYAYTPGSGVGLDWSPTVLTSDVDIVMKSPEIVSGTTRQQLKFHLAKVGLSCPNGIVLAGGQFVTIQITGVAEIQATPADYMYAELINGTAYTDLGITYS